MLTSFQIFLNELIPQIHLFTPAFKTRMLGHISKIYHTFETGGIMSTAFGILLQKVRILGKTIKKVKMSKESGDNDELDQFYLHRNDIRLKLEHAMKLLKNPW